MKNTLLYYIYASEADFRKLIGDPVRIQDVLLMLYCGDLLNSYKTDNIIRQFKNKFLSPYSEDPA